MGRQPHYSNSTITHPFAQGMNVAVPQAHQDVRNWTDFAITHPKSESAHRFDYQGLVQQNDTTALAGLAADKKKRDALTNLVGDAAAKSQPGFFERAQDFVMALVSTIGSGFTGFQEQYAERKAMRVAEGVYKALGDDPKQLANRNLAEVISGVRPDEKGNFVKIGDGTKGLFGRQKEYHTNPNAHRVELDDIQASAKTSPSSTAASREGEGADKPAIKQHGHIQGMLKDELQTRLAHQPEIASPELLEKYTLEIGKRFKANKNPLMPNETFKILDALLAAEAKEGRPTNISAEQHALLANEVSNILHERKDAVKHMAANAEELESRKATGSQTVNPAAVKSLAAGAIGGGVTTLPPPLPQPAAAMPR